MTRVYDTPCPKLTAFNGLRSIIPANEGFLGRGTWDRSTTIRRRPGSGNDLGDSVQSWVLAPFSKTMPMCDVTQILSQIEQGDPSAAEQLLPLIYDELRKLAAQKMAQEKPGQTLQPTALVHEA